MVIRRRRCCRLILADRFSWGWIGGGRPPWQADGGLSRTLSGQSCAHEVICGLQYNGPRSRYFPRYPIGGMLDAPPFSSLVNDR